MSLPGASLTRLMFVLQDLRLYWVHGTLFLAAPLANHQTAQNPQLVLNAPNAFSWSVTEVQYHELLIFVQSLT